MAPWKLTENMEHGRLRRFYERHANVIAYTIFIGLFIVSLLAIRLEGQDRREALAKETESRRVALATEQARINGALCAFYDNLESRYEAGVLYLKENPKGIEGISPEQIQSTLDGQRQTLDALSALECP